MTRQPRHAKPPFVGVGGKVEERVDEAQDPWIIIKEEAKRLRKEEGSAPKQRQGPEPLRLV